VVTIPSISEEYKKNIFTLKLRLLSYGCTCVGVGDETRAAQDLLEALKRLPHAAIPRQSQRSTKA